MLVYFWAYAAGVLTLVNPCVLPLLPIVIASALQGPGRVSSTAREPCGLESRSVPQAGC